VSPVAVPLPHPTCPLCGGPNRCAPAVSGSFAGPCWCSAPGVTIPPRILARIAPEQRGLACICARCAGIGTGDTDIGTDGAA
jgi:hypothetical protein